MKSLWTIEQQINPNHPWPVPPQPTLVLQTMESRTQSDAPCVQMHTHTNTEANTIILCTVCLRPSLSLIVMISRFANIYVAKVQFLLPPLAPCSIIDVAPCLQKL